MITLVAVVVGMMVACSSEPSATPTPAGPMYSEEEAIAVLKAHLQAKPFPRARQGITCFTLIDGEVDFWSARYDNEAHRWDVKARLFLTNYTWSVYERTKSIVANGLC